MECIKPALESFANGYVLPVHAIGPKAKIYPYIYVFLFIIKISEAKTIRRMKTLSCSRIKKMQPHFIVIMRHLPNTSEKGHTNTFINRRTIFCLRSQIIPVAETALIIAAHKLVV